MGSGMSTVPLGPEPRPMALGLDGPPVGLRSRRTPRAAAAYAWSYEQLFLRAWQGVVHKRPIPALAAELERTQWLPRVSLDGLITRKLRALLAHAQEHVPYYRELFAKLGFDARDVRSPTDVGALPLLTREIIQERYKDLVDPARAATNIRKGTSGTTGRPLVFEYGHESEAMRQAIRLRGYGWAGYRVGLPTLHYWAQGPTVLRGARAAKTALDRALRREVYVDAMDQDPSALRRAAEAIRRMKPHVIIGYTQATALLARFIAERGLRDWDDIPVLCGAEAVLPQDREVIARAFGAGVFETYGSRETMLVSAECSAHDGMHVSEENLLVEIVGDDRRPAPRGVAGDVVVTDLHNFGMPFIRYLNGDVASFADDDHCACGRWLRRIARVEGRRCDTLVDARGAPLPGMLFIALLAQKVNLVRQFQVVQKNDGKVTLKIVRGPSFAQPALDAITRRFKGYLRGLPLEVEVLHSIPCEPSGKRRPIVRLQE